jgi:hypothetical protein
LFTSNPSKFAASRQNSSPLALQPSQPQQHPSQNSSLIATQAKANMDALEFNAAAEASLPEGIASVLYLVHFVFVVLVATFALLLMIVLFPIAITWCIFLGLPM